jgi:hypothetical protein
VVKDPAEETTDSEDDLADSWDDDNNNNNEFDPNVDMEDIEMVKKDHHMSQSL